ncbi:TIR domain-containing protein [Brevibacillus daliensis]|uniref:TIR domain-containing protein n=1 Tax=Brevibacillus daliensis TaxID=2892995 RepID=UPI001E45A8A4|nr:nucleotide-binding protein [Brevibacillus daliensis]
MLKPKVFIGSSVEGLPIAYAIQENLSYVAEVTVWDQGVFHLSSTSLHDLLQETEHVDFAIFPFTPDDVSRIRDNEVKTVRDNVIFEFALFVSRLGMERVFYVVPQHAPDMHLPTDLAGITPGKYDANRSDARWKAALGPFCNQVKTQIAIQGPKPKQQDSEILLQKLHKMESHARFLYYLLTLSKHSESKYNQILSAFLSELEPPAGLRTKAATFFTISEDEKALEQLGSSGIVSEEKHRFPLQTEGRTGSYVAEAFVRKVSMLTLLRGDGFGLEYIYCRPIAEDFIITIHFLAAQAITEEAFEELLHIVYNANKDIFDSFHAFLKGELRYETGR